jgi:hypothetical protein
LLRTLSLPSEVAQWTLDRLSDAEVVVPRDLLQKILGAIGASVHCRRPLLRFNVAPAASGRDTPNADLRVGMPADAAIIERWKGLAGFSAI